MINFAPELKVNLFLKNIFRLRRPVYLAPMPSWGLLLSSLFAFCVRRPLRNILKSLSEYGSYVLFSHGRQALYFIAVSLHKRSNGASCVWVPDYYCTETLEPLYINSINVAYYPVLANSKPDIDYLGNADIKRGDLLIVVNYFGVESSWRNITEFSSSRDLYLLEDCAHCHFTSVPTKFAGDFIIYSFHKTYPVPNGACIIINHHGPKKLSCSDHLILTLTGRANKLNYDYSLPCYWIAKRMLQSLLPICSSPKSIPKSRISKPYVPVKMETTGINMVSLYMLDRLINNSPTIQFQRQECLNSWVDCFSALSEYVSVVNDCPFPYYAVFEIKMQYNPNIIIETLKEIQLPVLNWPDLSPTVISNPNNFTNAIALSRSRFMLPISNHISEKSFTAYKLLLNKSIARKSLTKPISFQTACSLLSTNCLSLTQSPYYIKTLSTIPSSASQFFLHFDLYSNPQYLFSCIQKKYLCGIFKIMILNQGPSPIGDHRSVENNIISIISFLRMLKQNSVSLLVHRPAFSKNYEKSYDLLINNLTLKNTIDTTSLIDLTQELQQIRSKLNGKWRNCLVKAEKSCYVKDQSKNTYLHPIFLQIYANYSKKIGFRSNRIDSLLELLACNHPAFKASIYCAYLKNKTYDEKEPLGFLLTINSGRSTTYAVGYSTDEGRQYQANSILLWHSIKASKKSGFSWYDLGGICFTKTPQIAKFKKGLNGCIMTSGPTKIIPPYLS